MTINPTSLGFDTNAQKPQLPVQEQAPVQPPPGALETFNSFLQRYVESNPALGLSNFQITPEALAVLGSKPENKLLAGIGSAAKGFSEGWGKVRAEQNANLQAQQKEKQGLEKQSDLAGEWGKVYGQYKNELLKYNQVKDNLKNKNTFGTALLSYAKLAIPELRTDEEAAAAIASGTGVLKAIQNTYDKWIKGEKIGDDERQSVLNSAKNMLRDRRNAYKGVTQGLEKRAKSAGIDIENIKLDINPLTMNDPITKQIYEKYVNGEGTPEELEAAKQILIAEGADL